MEEKRSSSWTQWLLLCVVIIAFGLVAWVFFSRYARFSQENLRLFIASFGAWAPIVFGVLYVIAAPVPFLAPVLSAVGGLLFGALWGTLLVIGVATLSALVPFAISRQLGRDWVETKLQGKKIDQLYQRSEGQGGLMFVLTMRLIPVIPWEIQNYLSGLTKVSVVSYIVGTVLGIIPGSFSIVFLGSAASNPRSWQFYVAIGLNVVMMAIVPAVALMVRKRKAAKEAA